MADDWIHLDSQERYAAAMRVAGDVRRARSQAAATRAVTLAHELAETEHAGHQADDARWSLRGEPRSRETFGDPHPLDFPGGLPLPADR